VTAPPLTGYLVVDLSSGIAGAYCTRILADGGADVVKVEPPEGDWLRSWTASGTPIAAGTDGALFSFLAGAKQSAVANPDRTEDLRFVAELLDGADAVIWSRGSRVAEVPTLSPAQIRRSHPHLVVTAISPFGLDGPWADRPATEFTLQAWAGGIIGLGRGAPDQAPVYVGGQVGEWLAGAYAAAATMTSWRRRGESGEGELIDLSILETQILGLTYFPVTFFEQSGRPWRTSRQMWAPGVATAKDGLVGLGCGTAQQWFDLCVMVGHPEWIDDDRPLLISKRAAELAPEIRTWIADRTVEEVCDLAAAFRIPHSPIINGANAATQEQFQVRQSLRANARDGFIEPAHPYRLSPATLRVPGPAPRLGEHTAITRGRPRPIPTVPPHTRTDQPFSGLRVLDMTAFWAGPSCTHVLALLGAEVIHLESTSRPDGTRLLAGVATTVDSWWERSGIFSGLNTNKKSLTIDFQDERGMQLLRRLITTCDVIVENYTPRVLERVGLTADAIRALRPDAIMVRMPGFGLDGPWRDNTAFAYVIEDASGLTWLTGYPDQNPIEPYSLGDPNAGLHALNAVLLALEHRRRTGEGVLIEAAMVDAALNIAAEQIIEFSAYGSLLQRGGNRGPAAAPQNLYVSADIDEFGRADSWVAIAVASDAQWAALSAALDEPAWTMDPALAAASGRRAAHDEIDEHLGEWCRQRRADDIVQRLWDAGVPVAKVMQPHRQTELAQLAARGFFESVDHPINGAVRHSTLPCRFSAGPQRFHLRHAPLLGQHNDELLGELGLTRDDIAALEADGIVGRAPILDARVTKPAKPSMARHRP
jgi:crotonobetainyl-CoA:carnitine CoA-transferase CaiB-like acyl-CoA transferase